MCCLPRTTWSMLPTICWKAWLNQLACSWEMLIVPASSSVLRAGRRRGRRLLEVRDVALGLLTGSATGPGVDAGVTREGEIEDPTGLQVVEEDLPPVVPHLDPAVAVDVALPPELVRPAALVTAGPTPEHPVA